MNEHIKLSFNFMTKISNNREKSLDLLLLDKSK